MINYVLRDDEGEIIDQSEKNDPLGYLHGHNNLVPGLEKTLAGKAKGDSFKVRVAAEEGYGAYDDSLVRSVEKKHFETEGELEIGMRFQLDTPDGETLVFQLTELNGDHVTIDGNHPLAGVALNFEIQIVDIRDASQDEITHGHMHSADDPHHHC